MKFKKVNADNYKNGDTIIVTTNGIWRYDMTCTIIRENENTNHEIHKYTRYLQWSIPKWIINGTPRGRKSSTTFRQIYRLLIS